MSRRAYYEGWAAGRRKLAHDATAEQALDAGLRAMDGYDLKDDSQRAVALCAGLRVAIETAARKGGVIAP